MSKLKAVIIGLFGGLLLAWFIDFCAASFFEQDNKDYELFLILNSIFLWILDFLNEHATDIIAVSAAAAAFIQGQRAWVQNRQSVEPFLTVGYGKEHEAGFSVYLKNIGLGPAIIEDYVVTCNNKKYRGTAIFDVLEAFFTGTEIKWSSYMMVKGFGIAVGEEIEILKVSEINPENFEIVQKAVHDNFGCVVVCSSLHKQRLTFTSNDYSWDDLKNLDELLAANK